MHLEEERDKVLMVGDRSHDVQGAVSCGLQCIGVTYGYGSREELESAGAVYIADSVEDLGILASPNDEETDRKGRVGQKRYIRQYDACIRKGIVCRRKWNRMEENTEEERENEYPKKTSGYSTVRQIWRLVYPFLIHYGATMLATIALYLIYIFQAGGVQEIASAGKRMLQSTLYVTLIGDVAAGVILYLFYRKDQQRRKEGFSGKPGKNFVWAPPVIWFSVIVLAIAIGQFLNDFIQVIHLNDLFPGYSQVSETAFGGQSMGLMILVVGIIGPVCEELMFRGIIFHRLKTGSAGNCDCGFRSIVRNLSWECCTVFLCDLYGNHAGDRL